MRTGILLCNLGTPDYPTTGSVARYLWSFLRDPRVVSVSPWIWWPLLGGIILPLRSPKSAAKYRAIWCEEGSPLRFLTGNLARSVQAELAAQGQSMEVAIGMRYGTPSLAGALDELLECDITHMMILPLYPQYASSSTGSMLQQIHTSLASRIRIPSTLMIDHYACDAHYISALADRIRSLWHNDGGAGEKLIISFHGIPGNQVQAGDPYPDLCRKTALELAHALELPDDRWVLAYQSRFGRGRWLLPNTQDILHHLGSKQMRNVDIVCPGFAVDCLETLEEISIGGAEIFCNAGGGCLRYIPALNDSELHVKALSAMIMNRLPLLWRGGAEILS